MKSIKIIDQVLGNEFTLYDNYLDTILRAFEGFEYATVRESIDDIAGTTGAIYVNSKFGRRRMGITGDLIGTDVFAFRRQLATVLRQTGTMKLIQFTTYDDLQLQCEAEVVKYTNPYNHKVHTLLLELVAPDYRFYSQELFSFDLDRTSIEAGATIPATIPWSIGLSTSTGSLGTIITSDGNEPTDPVFSIYGPGTDFTVTNETSDKSFVLTTTLSAGDVVVVDVNARTIIKNDTENLYTSFSGDFFTIEPGENEISFLINSGDDVDTRLNVSYRDAYNGV